MNSPKRYSRCRLLAAAAALLLLVPVRARAELHSGPPPTALVGSTLGQNLRNGAFTMQNQLKLLRTSTDSWVQRAQSFDYDDKDFRRDYDNISFHFHNFRTQFDYVGGLALGLGQPRADTTVAELETGLDIIQELFVFLSDEYNSGRLDRPTVARTARIFQKAIREWEHQARKNGSRIGVVW
ncbi:MAG TPA: hypothetical protein VJ063_16700 [Verrucomicrobiae bacterium]|nr:hypothetical protein [Verrucomicrobiae bacterium]